MSLSPSQPLHSSQEFWDVVEILKEGTHRYLVRWAGVDPKTNKPWPDSWVAKEDCTPSLILEWKQRKAQKVKPRGRPRIKNSESKDNASGATDRKPRSNTAKASKFRTPESTSTTTTKTKSSTSSPYVAVPRLPKRKNDVPPDSDEAEVRPKKRQKASKQGPVNRSLITVKVGPPGRAKEYVIPKPLHDSDEESIPIVSSKKRKKEATNEPSSSRRSSPPTRPGTSKSESTSRSRSKGTPGNDEADNRSSPDIPVTVERHPPKNGFSQEIIPETTQQQTSSSQSLRTSSKKLTRDNGRHKNGASRSAGHITRPTFNSRSRVASPIESFSPPQKLIQSFSKRKIVASVDSSQLEGDDNIRDEGADWLYEKHEEEESQSQPRKEAEPARSERKGGDSDLPAPGAIPYEPRRPVVSAGTGTGASALTSIFGRLSKVFKAIEPSKDVSDPIEDNSVEAAPSSHPQRVQPNQPSSPRTNDNGHNISDNDNDNNALRMDMYERDETQYIPNPFHEEVDELGPDDPHYSPNPLDVNEEVDELGPDDAADADVNAVDSSIVESQPPQNINSSLVVNAAQTQQQALQPVIESPVRQLDSALGLLHRKSEEIQLLRDQVLQVQEEVEKARHEMGRLDQELDRSEELREAQCLTISQLRAELMAVKGEAAVNVVMNALGSQQQQPADISDPSAVATELISTPTSEWLENLQREIEEHEKKITTLEHENDVLRKLYAQASSSHLDNLQELREVKRDNTSLREQATTGIRQANVFWQTQIDALSKKLKQSEAKAELLVQQNRATQEIRDKAALLPVAQKKTEAALHELEDWKDRVAELGMENTKLRIELKERDDAELARRRKEREMEEETKRLKSGPYWWLCSWRDGASTVPCAAAFDSEEALFEHCQDSHVMV